MKVLFTGSSGLIASWVVPYLKENDIEVDGYDIKNGDDMFDKEKLVKRMKTCDAVIHMAAIPHYKQKGIIVPKDIMFHTNLDGTRSVAEAAVEAGIKRFVFTSSGAVYGYDEQIFKPKSFPIKTNDLPNYDKLNFYAQSKRDCEAMLKEEFSDKMTVLVLRLNGINGKHTKALKHFFHYIEHKNQGKAYLNALTADVDKFEIFNLCEPLINDPTEKLIKIHWGAIPSTVKGNEALLDVKNTVEKLKIRTDDKL